MKEDYAIIVGIQIYPDLDDPGNGQEPLLGPENDAKAFSSWIRGREGGNVPKKNVRLILSSDYVPFDPPDQGQPGFAQIESAVRWLRGLSKKNIEAGNGPRIGRRLYLFMSGHGIAPTPYGSKTEKETGLLMANAERDNIGSPQCYLPGAYTANWFCENSCFDEVFLFMDCCRDITTVPLQNIYLPAKGNDDRAKRFYACATKWSRRAREKPMADEKGAVRGIFTKTLLLGLNGAAALPNPDGAEPDHAGIITGASLKSYLYQNMKALIADDFRDDPAIQEPDIDCFPKENEGRDIVIKASPLETFPVTISAPAGATGKVGIFSTFRNKLIEQFEATELPREIRLPREEYVLLATINGSLDIKPLSVRGLSVPH